MPPKYNLEPTIAKARFRTIQLVDVQVFPMGDRRDRMVRQMIAVDSSHLNTLSRLSLDVESARALFEGDVVTVTDGTNQTHWPTLTRVGLVDHVEIKGGWGMSSDDDQEGDPIIVTENV